MQLDVASSASLAAVRGASALAATKINAISRINTINCKRTSHQSQPKGLHALFWNIRCVVTKRA
jgi:hypothetical protein